MTNIKQRKSFFNKLAQAPGAPVPTDQVAQNKTIANPPIFQASSMYPGIRNGFNETSIILIDHLVNILNTALHYASAGTINFLILKNQNFTIDASIAPSIDQKNLINLSKKIYHFLLNGGTPFAKPMPSTQLSGIIDQIIQSPELNNLSTISPTGPIAQKIPGNLKNNIILYLNYLKMANPVQTT